MQAILFFPSYFLQTELPNCDYNIKILKTFDEKLSHDLIASKSAICNKKN